MPRILGFMPLVHGKSRYVVKDGAILVQAPRHDVVLADELPHGLSLNESI